MGTHNNCSHSNSMLYCCNDVDGAGGGSRTRLFQFGRLACNPKHFTRIGAPGGNDPPIFRVGSGCIRLTMLRYRSSQAPQLHSVVGGGVVCGGGDARADDITATVEKPMINHKDV